MKTVIANWKNHPATLAEAQELFGFSVREAIKCPSVRVVICPPKKFIKDLSLKTINYKLKTVFIGAQDVFWQLGEVVPAKYVLVGHSDRRKAGDTNEIVNQKLKSALAAGIMPVLLVGERNKGENRQTVLEEQLAKDFFNLTTSQVLDILIAYEPVWAISTNPDAEPDTPENTLKAGEIINTFLFKTCGLEPVAVLYGGSITENNVADFLKYPEIGGAVIGGASLRKEEFKNILKIVSAL